MLRTQPPLLLWFYGVLLAIWGVGMFGRGFWTPDEPREADIAWRMSWQPEKAVPLLAGEAFCEKPPFTYWMAAVPMKLFGATGWAARLPNLLYAVITALSVGALASRSAGRLAGLVAAAAVSTFLLSYQVAIWLATDAPLLAAVSTALLGLYTGFYADARHERLGGYVLMHVACGVGFLCKSAAAWVVPALALATLIVWEKRWRELLRWELYAGLLAQVMIIGAWVYSVYAGPQGTANLKVFFWNNLVGRFAHVDAPAELQYATAHRNTPGKYLLELPVYLFPWTFLVLAALRRAWRERARPLDELRLVRFGLAAFIPSLLLLSMAATARNIYMAPAIPGVALVVAWWVSRMAAAPDRWEVGAVRATAGLLWVAGAVLVAALVLVGIDSWSLSVIPFTFVAVSLLGLLASAALARRAFISAGHTLTAAIAALLPAYCALLIGPVGQLYTQVNAWQDLATLSSDIVHGSQGHPLILFAPDETTRGMIDMFAQPAAPRIEGPIDSHALESAVRSLSRSPGNWLLVQVPGRAPNVRSPLHLFKSVPIDQALPWLRGSHLKIIEDYSLPNGRRYALLTRE